jgi:hypothetical protein
MKQSLEIQGKAHSVIDTQVVTFALLTFIHFTFPSKYEYLQCTLEHNDT